MSTETPKPNRNRILIECLSKTTKTRYAIGQETQVSERTIDGWVRDGRPPRDAVSMLKVAKASGMSRSEFLAWYQEAHGKSLEEDRLDPKKERPLFDELRPD